MSGAVEGVALAYSAGFEQGWEWPRETSPTEAAERYAAGYVAALITPPARSYADGVEDAAKVLDARVARIKSLYADKIGMSDMRVACEMEAEAGAAAIRLLSQDTNEGSRP